MFIDLTSIFHSDYHIMSYLLVMYHIMSYLLVLMNMIIYILTFTDTRKTLYYSVYPVIFKSF